MVGLSYFMLWQIARSFCSKSLEAAYASSRTAGLREERLTYGYSPEYSHTIYDIL
jgi:hypothetical protein